MEHNNKMCKGTVGEIVLISAVSLSSEPLISFAQITLPRCVNSSLLHFCARDITNGKEDRSSGRTKRE